MKNNLMLKRYTVEYDNGTKNMNNFKSYFGSNLIDIEDIINIDNNTIQYSDENDYQYYDNTNTNETNKNLNLTTLKDEYHTLSIQTQDIYNIQNNTKWNIDIDIKSILKEYLFARIKENRTFKTVNKGDTKNKDINDSIYNFITYNIINRYEFYSLNLYVKYNKLRTTNIFNTNSTQYNNIYNSNIYDDENEITSFNLIKKNQFENLSKIKIQFNQIKSSTEYNFDYYFNINFKKI
jgi:hypothetical protein